MNLIEIDEYYNSFLKKEDYLKDISLNGIQIQNSSPSKKQINKIAFAVDACEETALRAVKEGADLLFVHHGLFWGHCQTITGSLYKRLSVFMNNDLALCAYHIPLDANNPYGNNWGLANRLKMTDLQDFGYWKGMPIGVKGLLPVEMTINELAEKVVRKGCAAKNIIALGKEKIRSVGIISGGASEDVADAIEQKLDCYITGEFVHEQYHLAREMQMNVISAGHYETETVGPTLIMEKTKKELGLDVVFIDCPTNL